MPNLLGFTTPVESVRSQLVARQGGADDARLIAVVTNRQDRSGQQFRLPTVLDYEIVETAKAELKRRIGETLKSFLLSRMVT